METLGFRLHSLVRRVFGYAFWMLMVAWREVQRHVWSARRVRGHVLLLLLLCGWLGHRTSVVNNCCCTSHDWGVCTNLLLQSWSACISRGRLAAAALMLHCDTYSSTHLV
jgi:hypothetical protein